MRNGSRRSSWAALALFLFATVPAGLAFAEDDEGAQVLVIDMTAATVKIGFAGDDTPRAVFPAIVGVPRHAGVMVGMGQKEAYVGDEAQSKRGILDLHIPVQDGVVTNWDYLTKMLHHAIYNEIRVAPEAGTIVVTMSAAASKSDIERMVGLLFDTFNAQAVYIAREPTMMLYASGRATGVAVQGTNGVIEVVPIYEGFILPHAVIRLKDGAKSTPEAIAKAIHTAIEKTDSEIHAELYKNIVLSNGNEARLTSALAALAPEGTEIDIAGPPSSKHSIWLGASLLASTNTFPNMCLTNKKYAKKGAAAVSAMMF